jgi:hypothetical protein
LKAAVSSGKAYEIGDAVGQHHLAVARMVEVERLEEVGRFVEHRSVHAVERDLFGPLLHAGHIPILASLAQLYIRSVHLRLQCGMRSAQPN